MVAWILIPCGVLMIKYAKNIVDIFGEFEFAERVFVTGGTYTFVKLLGLSITILSFMWAVGGLQPILKSILGPVFGV